MEPRLSLGAALLGRWRNERKLSQVEASERLGLEDQGWYSKLERGFRKPGRSLAVRIEQVTDGQVPVASWDLPPPSPGLMQPTAKAS